MTLRAVLVLLVLTGCSSMGTEPPDTEAAALPLLHPALTLGTTLYGGADVASQPDAVRALLETAAARGLGGFTYYVDWADLEPEPGRYALGEFTATLGDLRRLGVVPFVNITVGDIEDYNLPAEYSDGAGGLADGVALDDPEVIERFGRLVDRVVPLLVSHDGFFLGVGNEVDARLDGSFAGERDAYVRFVEAARDRAHATEPRLAVGVTLTNQAVRRQTPTFRALRAVADVVPFNHAPIRPDFFVLDLDEVGRDFREVVAAYGRGPILIQELTCPSPASMGASDAWQRGCFERLLGEIQATPQIRFASVFTLQDLDPPTCEAVREFIFGDELEDLPEDVAARLTDYLCFLGVVDPAGAPKPAWATLLEAFGRASPGLRVEPTGR